MPTLNWIGKEKVVNHHQDVPYRILEHKYGFSAALGKQENPTNSGNKIIHGDNLEALKSLLPEYEGKIKCIYIDPPYNTGNENWVYNDNVNHPKIKKWLGEVVGKQGEDLTRHDKWLCMMYPRLVLLHKLLSDDGAIFISIDDNEQASLKLMMDEIFSRSNFVNSFIVQRRVKSLNSQFSKIKSLNQGFEYIFCYQKSKDFYYVNPTKEANQNRKDGYWNAFWNNADRPTMRYEIGNINIEKGQWKWEKERGIRAYNNYLEFIKNHKEEEIKDYYFYNKDVYFENNGVKLEFIKPTKTTVKYYLPPSETTIADTNFINYYVNDDTGKRKYGFDTTKNLELIEKILSLVSNKDSIILDSFAGSGTTAHAVLNLNKEDGGNRKFILIEMEDYAETITSERVKRVISLNHDLHDKNDLKKNQENQENHSSDIGFDFYELGLPIFKDDKNLNEEVGEEKIREYIYFTETKQYLQRERTEAHKYLLDTLHETGYYFYYEKDNLTVLNSETLNIVTEVAGQYLIYADVCLLDSDYMLRNKIIFKKIPRDVKKL